MNKRGKPLVFNINDNDCFVCTSHTKQTDGYINIGRGGKVQLMHRYLWEKHKGSIPNGMVLMHTCDNPSCCNLSHLVLGTQADNCHDRDNKRRHAKTGNQTGIHAKGENHGRSKITAIVARLIKYENFIPDAIITDVFNISHGSLWMIRNGRNWKHI